MSKTRQHIYLDDSHTEYLRKIAERDGSTLAWHVRKAVEEYVAKLQKKEKGK